MLEQIEQFFAPAVPAIFVGGRDIAGASIFFGIEPEYKNGQFYSDGWRDTGYTALVVRLADGGVFGFEKNPAGRVELKFRADRPPGSTAFGTVSNPFHPVYNQKVVAEIKNFGG